MPEMSIGDYLVLQSNPISEMARGSSSLCVFEIVQSVPSAQLTWNSTIGPGPDRYRSASGNATVIEPGIEPKLSLVSYYTLWRCWFLSPYTAVSEL